MNTLLEQREKWKETCKRLQQDIYRLERQVQVLQLDLQKTHSNYIDRLAQKDVLINKMDKENQRLRDEMSVLELEINVLKAQDTTDSSDVSLTRWWC